MTEPTELSNAELQALWQNCRRSLNSLVASLDERPDMQETIRQLMKSDDTREVIRQMIISDDTLELISQMMKSDVDMLEAFIQIGMNDPDLERIMFKKGFGETVDPRSAKLIEAEQKRRAGMN